MDLIGLPWQVVVVREDVAAHRRVKAPFNRRARGAQTSKAQWRDLRNDPQPRRAMYPPLMFGEGKLHFLSPAQLLAVALASPR